MRSWSAKVPKKEGWYFWRKKGEDDPWKYNVIFIMERDKDENEDTNTYWECGVSINQPKRGEWSSELRT